jgi:hypothetical protein
MLKPDTLLKGIIASLVGENPIRQFYLLFSLSYTPRRYLEPFGRNCLAKMAQLATTTAVLPTDPHSNKLEDRAAAAALSHSPKHDNINHKNGYDILDADHKLSSAGE